MTYVRFWSLFSVRSYATVKASPTAASREPSTEDIEQAESNFLDSVNTYFNTAADLLPTINKSTLDIIKYVFFAKFALLVSFRIHEGGSTHLFVTFRCRFVTHMLPSTLQLHRKCRGVYRMQFPVKTGLDKVSEHMLSYSCFPAHV